MPPLPDQIQQRPGHLQSFWARGYFVSTVGLDEEVVREYIRHQEKEGQRLEQLNLVWSAKKAQ